MDTNIWIAIINSIKDIILAIIGFFKDMFLATIRLKEKPSKKQNLPEKHFAFKEDSDNPFIPSDIDIEKVDIKDQNYLITIATYLASNRASEDINVIDKEGE